MFSLFLAWMACSAEWALPDADGDGFTVAEGDCWDNPVGPVDTGLGKLSDDLTGADVGPQVTEIWYDGVDEDCDGWDDFDADRDGHRTSKLNNPATGQPFGDDCFDSVELIPASQPIPDISPGAVHPGAADAEGDGIDANCDGVDGVAEE